MKYRLSGKYYTPPDRGSADGDWNSFSHTFSAAGDSAACEYMKRYLAKKYTACDLAEDFKNLNLIRIEEVDLSRVLA